MWSLPLDVRACPFRWLHWVDVEGAIVRWELRVRPLLTRFLHKLLNLLHHLTHLVFRGLLDHRLLLFLVLAMISVLLAVWANLLVIRHSILVVIWLIGLDLHALMVIVLLLIRHHAFLLHLLHLGHHRWVLHHCFLLHLVLLLLLHG